MAVKKQANPMKTKTGKQRLGPLSLKQLYELLEKESKPKNKGKIRSRIRIMEQRGQKYAKETVEAENVPV
jgi:hypothetical protein